jgi:hypothetical protein
LLSVPYAIAVAAVPVTTAIGIVTVFAIPIQISHPLFVCAHPKAHAKPSPLSSQPGVSPNISSNLFTQLIGLLTVHVALAL